MIDYSSLGLFSLSFFASSTNCSKYALILGAASKLSTATKIIKRALGVIEAGRIPKYNGSTISTKGTTSGVVAFIRLAMMAGSELGVRTPVYTI